MSSPQTERKYSMKNLNYFLLTLALIVTILPSKSHAAAEPIPIKRIWVGSFMLMAEQFTTTMILQIEIIGTFFDAKHQLETQRLFQQKVAEAHKDYHPSEQMCEIGTFVRDLADSQERIKVTRNAIQNASLARALGTGDVKTMDDRGSGSDQLTRRRAYIDEFCNVNDNAAQNTLLCETSKEAAQQNADLNYTQTIDGPLTINLNFIDPDITPEEENIFSFMDQIFMNEPFTDVARANTINHKFVKPYQEMRSLTAMRSVAQNSFAHIIGEKTVGPEEQKVITPFINALLEEMGLSDELMLNLIGEHPSYYAQMEILTKKIYQHPEFISNLYDKPANVKRIRAAMSAIKLMQDRDISNAMQRREMLTSMILELQLRYKQNELTGQAEKAIFNLPETSGTGVQNAPGTGAGF